MGFREVGAGILYLKTMRMEIFIKGMYMEVGMDDLWSVKGSGN